MIIQKVHVRNFRSLYDTELMCDDLTALVGRNGTGKSSFLSAIELFYTTTPQIVVDDFYSRDTSNDIEIGVTFSDLRTAERQFFVNYINGDTLTVVRVFCLSSDKLTTRYHGMRRQHPQFYNIRNAGSKTEIRAAYNRLRQEEPYKSLPTVRSADAALAKIGEWEKENDHECEWMRDEGQFFGFSKVAQGYLGRYTRFIKVPAVRDASADATDGRGSCISELMDLVVRNVLQSRKDLAMLKADTQKAYKRLLDPDKLSELRSLESEMTATLRQFVTEARISLDWSELIEVTIPMPKATVRLSEDGYETTVERTGHGLQRAFILTLLQQLAVARQPNADQDNDNSSQVLPNVVLAIEEPELYQHPTQQRHLARVLRQLSQRTATIAGSQTQIVYATHAPLFVGLDRFDQIRLLRKETHDPEKPKVTVVSMATLDTVARQLRYLMGGPKEEFTPDSVRTRMHTVMTPWMNEGFFADTVVLVEGEGDRSVVLAAAELKGSDLSAMGVAVIPCGGKTNIDRPAVVFKELGIPLYLIWDNDKAQGSHSNQAHATATNRRLLQIVQADEEDWPAGVWPSHACLSGNLEKTLKNELTPVVFDRLLKRAASVFHMGVSRARKNPVVLRKIIREANHCGMSSITLAKIIENLVGHRT